jgi:hypothetical protein
LAAEDTVDHLGDVLVHGDVAPVLDLHYDVERGRRFALED